MPQGSGRGSFRTGARRTRRRRTSLLAASPTRSSPRASPIPSRRRRRTRGSHGSRATPVRAYGVVLDAHGRIAWGRSDIGGDPIVVVLSEMVSDAHLAGLRSEGVSYIFAGKSQLDLALTLDAFSIAKLGVKRLPGYSRRRRRNQWRLSARGTGRRVQPCSLSRCRRRQGARQACSTPPRPKPISARPSRR